MNDCWHYAGSHNAEGYGLIFDGHKQYRAHRVMYENEVGTISPDLVLDHLCRNRNCINPAHLEPVTNKENILRGISEQAFNAQKIACPRGHKYDIVRQNGNRRCSICDREAWKLQTRRKYEKRLALEGKTPKPYKPRKLAG